MAKDKQTKKSGDKHGDYQPVPLMEWVCSALGLLIVLTLMGYTAYHAGMREDSDADVSVEVLSVQKLAHNYLVRVRAYNHGGKAAAGVLIQGRLKTQDQADDKETAEFNLDYLPPHSQVEGGLFFSENPADFPMHVRAAGYHDP